MASMTNMSRYAFLAMLAGAGHTNRTDLIGCKGRHPVFSNRFEEKNNYEKFLVRSKYWKKLGLTAYYFMGMYQVILGRDLLILDRKSVKKWVDILRSWTNMIEYATYAFALPKFCNNVNDIGRALKASCRRGLRRICELIRHGSDFAAVAKGIHLIF